MRTTTVEQVLEATQATLLAEDYCFLITLGESGKVNARLMQHYKPENDLIVWFGASPKSRKVQEIRANNHITVACVNTQESGYVTLVGSAQIEDSIDLRRKYWREEWMAFFPEGPMGNDYILIRFNPVRVEVMNFGRRITPEPYGLQPALVRRIGDKWVLGKG